MTAKTVKTRFLFDWLYGYKKGDSIQVTWDKYIEMRDIGLVEDIEQELAALQEKPKGGCSDCN